MKGSPKPFDLIAWKSAQKAKQLSDKITFLERAKRPRAWLETRTLAPTRRALLGGLCIAGLPVSRAIAGMLIRGGNLTDLPPPPPPPPFVPVATPTQTVTLTWTGSGDPLSSGGVSEGHAGDWTLASTDYPSLDGQTADTLDSVYNLVSVVGDATIYLPAGNFQVGTSLQRGVVMDVPGRSIAWVGAGAYQDFGLFPIYGDPRLWSTVLKGNRVNNQPVFWIDDSAHTSTITIQNIAISPFAADIASNPNIQAGGSAGLGLIFKVRCGILQIVECQIARSRSNGFSSTTQYEWDSSENDIVLFFYSELYGCGANQDQHNHYGHCCLVSRMINCFSHDSGGHAYKVDGGTWQPLGSTFGGTMLGAVNPPIVVAAGTAGAINPLESKTYCSDFYSRGNLYASCISSGTVFASITTVRRESAGFISTKYPPYFGRFTGSNQSRSVQWFYGGFTGSQDTIAAVKTAASGSTLALKAVAGKLSSAGRTITDTTPSGWDVMVLLTNGTVQQMTATVTTTGSQPVLALDTPLSSSVAVNQPVLLKKTSQNWDYPVLSASNGIQDLNDTSSPSYYWPLITVGGLGVTLDFTKQASSPYGFNVHYHESNLYSILTSTRTQCQVFEFTRDFLMTYGAATNLFTVLPFGNMKSTDASYPDPANGGTFNAQLQANAGSTGIATLGLNATGGLGSSGSNVIRNNWMALKNIGVNDLAVAAANRFTAQFDTTEQDASGGAWGTGVPTNVQYVKSDGTWGLVPDNVKTTTGNPATNASPMPTSKKFSLASAVAAHDMSITTGAVTGGTPAIGEHILIQLINGRGVHYTTITNVTSLGGGAYTLDVADEFDFPANSGGVCACFTASGANPSGWLTPEQWPL